MKTISPKYVTAAGTLLISGLLWMASINAQEGGSPQVASLKTNWVGYLVFGTESPEIIGGPFPKADKQFELGLRSDGVVVWRRHLPEQ